MQLVMPLFFNSISRPLLSDMKKYKCYTSGVMDVGEEPTETAEGCGACIKKVGAFCRRIFSNEFWWRFWQSTSSVLHSIVLLVLGHVQRSLYFFAHPHTGDGGEEDSRMLPAGGRLGAGRRHEGGELQDGGGRLWGAHVK